MDFYDEFLTYPHNKQEEKHRNTIKHNAYHKRHFSYWKNGKEPIIPEHDRYKVFASMDGFYNSCKRAYKQYRKWDNKEKGQHYAQNKMKCKLGHILSA